MVNTATAAAPGLRLANRLVGAYVLLTAITIATLAVLSGAAPAQASGEAWGHAVVVACFAALLPLRLRAAHRGSATAPRRIALIAGVLVAVNVVEAALPGVFPAWMRVEMVATAGLMGCLLAAVLPPARRR